MARAVNCENVLDYYEDHFTLECGAPAVTLYESTFNQTQVAATIYFKVDSTPCTVTITVTEGDGDTLPPFVITSDTGIRDVNLTLRALRSITVGCSGGTAGNYCPLLYRLQLHYCKCC